MESSELRPGQRVQVGNRRGTIVEPESDPREGMPEDVRATIDQIEQAQPEGFATLYEHRPGFTIVALDGEDGQRGQVEIVEHADGRITATGWGGGRGGDGGRRVLVPDGEIQVIDEPATHFGVKP